MEGLKLGLLRADGLHVAADRLEGVHLCQHRLDVGHVLLQRLEERPQSVEGLLQGVSSLGGSVGEAVVLAHQVLQLAAQAAGVGGEAIGDDVGAVLFRLFQVTLQTGKFLVKVGHLVQLLLHHLDGTADGRHAVKLLLQGCQLAGNLREGVIVLSERLGSLLQVSVGVGEAVVKRVELVVKAAQLVANRR